MVSNRRFFCFFFVKPAKLSANLILEPGYRLIIVLCIITFFIDLKKKKLAENGKKRFIILNFSLIYVSLVFLNFLAF